MYTYYIYMCRHIYTYIKLHISKILCKYKYIYIYILQSCVYIYIHIRKFAALSFPPLLTCFSAASAHLTPKAASLHPFYPKSSRFSFSSWYRYNTGFGCHLHRGRLANPADKTDRQLWSPSPTGTEHPPESNPWTLLLFQGKTRMGPLKSSRQQVDLGFSFTGEWLGDGRAPFQVANSPPVRG